MPKGCTPDNVMGQLTAGLEAQGKNIEDKYILKKMTVSERAAYNQGRSRGKAEAFDAFPDSERQKSDNAAVGFIKGLTGDPVNTVKGIINEQRNPSGKFGEDTIRPVIDFITDHYSTYHDNLAAGRDEYFTGIQNAFDQINPNAIPKDLRGEFKQYYNFYVKEGGELYKEYEQHQLGKPLQNLAGNIIQSSSTVLIGNVLEGAIKLPSLYTRTFIPGILKGAVKGKGIFKIPELEKLGVYGRKYAGKGSDGWNVFEKVGTLIEATDVPLKNFAYYAGEMRGGQSEGLRAVQRVSFMPRFGDLPSIYYTSAGRNDIRFLSYTINTYKMYGDALRTLATGNGPDSRGQAALTLAGLIAIPWALGGAKGTIPEPVVKLIKSYNEDLYDEIEETKTPLSGFIQAGGIGRINVVSDAAYRQGQKVWKSFSHSLESWHDGDVKRWAIDLADAGFKLMPFAKTPLGDVQLQKLQDLAKDVFLDELEDPIEERLQKDFLPALNR